MPNFTIEQLETAMRNPEMVRTFSIVAQVDAGKCFSEGTLIRLSDGSLKPVELLTMNDAVIGLDGKAKRIVEIHQGTGLMYEVQQNFGVKYTVNGQHTLVLKIINKEGIFWDQKGGCYKVRYMQNLRLHDVHFYHDKSKELTQSSKQQLYNRARRFFESKQQEVGYNRGNDTVEISVEEYLKLPNNIKKSLYGFKQCVDFTQKPVDLDAYILGFWLGNGTATEPTTGFANENMEYNFRFVEENNLAITVKDYEGGTPCFCITDGKDSDSFLNSLKKYDLIENKRIPHNYLFNSRAVRLAVLAGLIDSIGHVHRNTYKIIQPSDGLTSDIIFLVQSLGFRITCSKASSPGADNVMQISGRLLDELPLLLDYKKLPPNNKKNFLVSRISVTPRNIGRYIGFQIEGDGKFFAPDFTVWHNSTLSDSLLCHAGLVNKNDAGDKRQTDTMKQEQERGITIKAVGVSMCVTHDEKDYVLGLVDSPGHVDFNSEVSCSIRVTDGALVLIDTVDGVMAQTKTVLTQTLAERVKPVLVINKIDKLFLSLKKSPEEIYDQFIKNVQDVNAVIEEYQDQELVKLVGSQTVDPAKGNVVFGAAYQTWGFSLKTMAKFYAMKNPEKFNMPTDKLMKLLWQKENFINYVLRPINMLLNACEAYPAPLANGKTLDDIMKVVGIRINKEDYDLRGLKLIRKVMNSWLPVSNAVVELAIEHLPSPKLAQSYRADLLYKGPKDDVYYNAIKNCDASGPLIIYISKMVPSRDNSRFYAFGRVFAGSATATKILVLLNDHDPSSNENRKTYVRDNIQRVLLMMANKIETIYSVPAGNILGLDGIDKSMVKSGTIVDEKSVDCFPLKNIAFSVSPVVQYALRPKNPADLSKFVEQMKKFVKSDPCLQYILTKDGEHVLAGAGELHLEVAIEQLRTDFLKGIEFELSEPIVPYCETIIETSSIVCLAKSPNKHNRLYFTARPLDTELVDMMLDDGLPKDPKERARILIEKYGFGEESRKIWKLGPEIDSSNMLLDDTKGVQYLNEIRDSVSSGFIRVCDGGPLCDEPIRGVAFCLKDVNLHADAVHRGAGQLLPATGRVMFASMLTAKPRLLEPVFSVEIRLPRDMVSTLYGLMTKRRGSIKTVEEENIGNIMRVEAELPVAESFGYIEDLRSVTSGMAFATLSFSHWQIVPGDPMEDGSYANIKMMEIRKRKGLKLVKPALEEYNDKL